MSEIYATKLQMFVHKWKRAEDKAPAAEQIKRILAGVETLIQVDAMCDVGREVGVWHQIRDVAGEANRRVRARYEWGGMQSPDGKQKTLIVKGQVAKTGENVRELERRGWVYVEATQPISL